MTLANPVMVQASTFNIQQRRLFVLTDRFCFLVVFFFYLPLCCRHQRRGRFPMSSERLTTFSCIPSRRRTNNPTALNAVSGKLRGCSLLSDALDVFLSDDTVGLLCKTQAGLHNSVAEALKMRARVLEGPRFKRVFCSVRAIFFFLQNKTL